MLRSSIFLALILVASGPCAARDVGSGQAYEIGCRKAVSRSLGNRLSEVADAGKCYGAVTTLLLLGEELQESLRFCRPLGSDVGEGIRIVLKYMNDNPRDMHMPFAFLGIAALRAAWPCSSN
jgi:hypothetical protein